MHETESRTRYSIRNFAFGIGGYAFSQLVNFAYRTLFIYVLGVTYLGIQGLFSNVLSILSLAELGVASTITFSLYAPLAERNWKKTAATMNLLAFIYKIMGAVVAVAGLSLLPFLDVFIKDRPDINNLGIIYLMFLADSVVTYFFAYKRTLIIADQKAYINTLNTQVFFLIRTVLQIFALLLFKNFILLLGIQIASSLIANITISIKADRMYPQIKKYSDEKLCRDDRKSLWKKVYAMALHKLGATAAGGTSNLLISTFIGIVAVGLYANYVMIVSVLHRLIDQLFTSVAASVGNLVSVDDSSRSKNIFDTLYFANAWIYFFCSVVLTTLFNPFITMWIGTEFTFQFPVVVLIVVAFYMEGLRKSILAFRNALGLFYIDRFKPIAEGVTNLVVAIILLQFWGVEGVFIGIIACKLISLVVEPYVLFKYYFKDGLIKYYVDYLCYFCTAFGAAVVLQLVAEHVFKHTWNSLLLLFVITLIFPNLLFWVLFRGTSKYKDFFRRVKNVIIHRDMNPDALDIK